MEELLKSVEEVLKYIEEGTKEKRFPEAMRTYVEQLGRNIRLFLDVVKVSTQENTIQSPISPSSRGAMFNLRKAFYATLTRLAREQGVSRERSMQEWKAVASRLIEEIEKRGITEAPCKIVLTYHVAEEGQTRYIAFKDARVLYFDLEGVLRVDFAAAQQS